MSGKNEEPLKEKVKINYTYENFIEEGKKLCEESNNVFKFCLNELLNINYIQGNLNISESIILELDIIFSDVYSLPVMYYQIYKDGIPYDFDLYIKEYPSVNEDLMKNAKISKENHPFTGRVYYFLHLCQFNFMIKQIDNIKNILYFWLGLVLQIFNFDIIKIIKLYK